VTYTSDEAVLIYEIKENDMPHLIIIIILKKVSRYCNPNSQVWLEKYSPHSSPEIHATSHSYTGYPGIYADPQAVYIQVMCVEETYRYCLLVNVKVTHTSGKVHTKMFFLQA
jgi:hypothetical protein